MDIALLSMALHQGKVQQQIGVSLMKKNLEQIGNQGANVTQLLDSAQVKQIEVEMQSHLGVNVDIRI